MTRSDIDKKNVIKKKRTKDEAYLGDTDYLSNKDMTEEVILSQKNGKVTDKLGRMIMLLCKRYSNHRYFVRYSYKDEMIASGILACVAAVFKFDTEKSSNAFAFFTTTTYRAYRHVQIREKKNQDLRDAMLIEAGSSPSMNFSNNDESGSDED